MSLSGDNSSHPRQQINPNRIYNRRQLARLLRVSYNTIKNAVKAGRLREFNYTGKRTYRYLGQWVIDWIEASETRPQESRVEKPPRQPQGLRLKHLRLSFPTS